MQILTIGQLAKTSGVHLETIRYYEWNKGTENPPHTGRGGPPQYWRMLRRAPCGARSGRTWSRFPVQAMRSRAVRTSHRPARSWSASQVDNGPSEAFSLQFGHEWPSLLGTKYQPAHWWRRERGARDDCCGDRLACKRCTSSWVRPSSTSNRLDGL